MRIVVLGSAGSSRSSVVGRPVTDSSRFESFCTDLGMVLARHAHTILVESDRLRSADRHVVDGILADPGGTQARIEVYYRAQRREEAPFAHQRGRHKEHFRLVPLDASLLTFTHLQMLADADAAVIVGGGKNSYTAGSVAALIGVRLIPAANQRGAGEKLWQELRDSVRRPALRLPAPENWDRLTGTDDDVLDAIGDEVGGYPRVMVVHGRSADRIRVGEILEAAGVRAPIVLRDKLGTGTTVPEKFEREARQADAAVVLFTPDEEVAVTLDANGDPISEADIRKRSRVRQNVSVELGWFWALLGRHRVLLVVKDGVELPSDLSGLDYVRYRESPDECRTAIARFVDVIRGR